MRRKKAPLITDEREAILREHLPYRIWMIRCTHQLMQMGIFSGPVQNAVIESFAIHARALIEFFTGRRREAKASDFTDDAYELLDAASAKEAIQLTRHISAAIAHVQPEAPTEQERKLNIRDWNQLFAMINVESERFVQHLRPELRSVWGAPRR